MADIPLPQPLSDEEAADLDYLFENYEFDRALQEWETALDWAKKGDFRPLSECLRRNDLPLNNSDVRTWLADGLVNGFKKPRKVAKAPDYMLFQDASGRKFHIDKRYFPIFEAMKFIEENTPSLGEDEAIKKAVKELRAKGFSRMTSEKLRADLDRTQKRWGLRPKKEKTAEEMFGAVLQQKE